MFQMFQLFMRKSACANPSDLAPNKNLNSGYKNFFECGGIAAWKTEKKMHMDM